MPLGNDGFYFNTAIVTLQSTTKFTKNFVIRNEVHWGINNQVVLCWDRIKMASTLFLLRRLIIMTWWDTNRHVHIIFDDGLFSPFILFIILGAPTLCELNLSLCKCESLMWWIYNSMAFHKQPIWLRSILPNDIASKEKNLLKIAWNGSIFKFYSETSAEICLDRAIWNRSHTFRVFFSLPLIQDYDLFPALSWICVDKVSRWQSKWLQRHW